MTITNQQVTSLAAQVVQMITSKQTARKFPLGGLYVTPGVLAELDLDEVNDALCRHMKGDWGDVCEEDRQENEFALGKYLRLFSVYHSQAGQKFWVITEADRSATTVLLPEEY
jgi:hypothetical protein